MPQYAVLNPYQPVRAGRLRICPPSNADGRFQVICHASFCEELAQVVTVDVVPFHPCPEMFLRGEEIALIPVALLMSKDEVVAQINGLFRPRYEMVDLALVAEGLVAVEACVFLDFSKYRAVDIQGHALGPE